MKSKAWRLYVRLCDVPNTQTCRIILEIYQTESKPITIEFQCLRQLLQWLCVQSYSNRNAIKNGIQAAVWRHSVSYFLVGCVLADAMSSRTTCSHTLDETDAHHIVYDIRRMSCGYSDIWLLKSIDIWYSQWKWLHFRCIRYWHIIGTIEFDGFLFNCLSYEYRLDSYSKSSILNKIWTAYLRRRRNAKTQCTSACGQCRHNYNQNPATNKWNAHKILTM